MSKISRRTVSDAAIIFIFAAIVGLPLLDLFFKVDPIETSENRNLAPTPYSITAILSNQSVERRISKALSHAEKMPNQLKAYLEDHFGFRSSFLRVNAEIKYNLLNVSPSKDVVLGREVTDSKRNYKHRWLFFKPKAVEHFRAVNLFTSHDLNLWKQVLEQRTKTLKELGIQYYLVVAPNKHTVYPEYLPKSINRVHHNDRSDQFVSFMKEYSNVKIIDTRPVLKESKEQSPDVRTYHRTDSHWNDAGAFLAYQAIANELQRDFPTITPNVIDYYSINQEPRPGMGDLGGMIGLRNQFIENVITYKPKSPTQPRLPPDYKAKPFAQTFIKNSSGNHLRLLIFRDSFGEQIVPFLAPHFSESLIVNQHDAFDIDAIDSFKPNAVISLWVERKLVDPVPPVFVTKHTGENHFFDLSVADHN